MESAIKPNKLFTSSCIALLVTGLSFGIRAAALGGLGKIFSLDAGQLALIAGTAFWGFPLAVIAGGFLVDIIGMKRILQLAGVFHLVGITLWVFAGGFWSLYISTLLIGIANGTVESACNPLVATIYSGNKTTKLNHFHLWFPGGIFIGTLVAKLFDLGHLDWRIQGAVMLIPTAIYLYNFASLSFPPTERVASGVSTASMFKAVLSPLFLCMIILMIGTAITELFTGQWIPLLLENVTTNAILILTLTAGVQILGRAFAGPMVHRLSPTGVLIISAILSASGIYMLANLTGSSVFIGAIVFGMGVTYFWPTMLGFVSENIPKSGALGMNLMGGAGMFAISIYGLFMGKAYDHIIARQLPAGAVLNNYQQAAPESAMGKMLTQASKLAGPDILMRTFFIPCILIGAFILLYFYMKGRPKPVLSNTIDQEPAGRMHENVQRAV